VTSRSLSYLTAAANARYERQRHRQEVGGTKSGYGLVVERGVVALAGAGAAEGAAVDLHFAFEVDAFVALVADDAGTFEPGEIFGTDLDADPLLVEQLVIGDYAVGFLLSLFFFECGEHFAGAFFGIFAGDDADGAVGFEVDEGGGDLSPVEEFEGALAEAAIGDEGDGVGHAAVDFDVGDDTFSIADGIFDAEFAEAEHGETGAEDLAGADVAVGDGGFFEVLVEGFHFGV
jgi:hypothetical protein